MTTPFVDKQQEVREREARLVLGDIESCDSDKLERWTSVNGLDLIERMRETNCVGVTEGQLDFLRSIRDTLIERGAI